MGRLALLLALVVSATLAGSAGGRTSDGEGRKSFSPPSTAQSATTLGSCPVTVPNGRHPPKNAGFNHGNSSLWVALWPHGKLLAGMFPDGSSRADIRPDGSIDAKLGWWHDVPGKLTIRGQRLDAPGPPLRADIPQGYGVSGFQATGVIFPTEGCWRVTGRAGEATLSFVTLVVKRQPLPAALPQAFWFREWSQRDSNP
jgi:hypothetical protein